MSVITVGDIDYLPYAGYGDPGLPDRVWIIGLTSTGDAGGGVNTAQINLKAAGVQPGNIFSLEQISVESADQADAAVEIAIAGMQVFPPDFTIPAWTVLLVPNDPDTDTLLPLASSSPKKWLGRAAGPTAGTVSMTITNATSAAFLVTATGYMWTPGAINAPGGPRRPISGVFSN